MPTDVLVLLAHPDDPEFFVGGSIAFWTSQGMRVVVALATRGDKGADNTDLSASELSQLREQEQRKASELLGVSELIFLDYLDGELEYEQRLVRTLVRLIRIHQPTTVVTTDPERYIVNDRRLNHSDHRVMGRAVTRAVFPAAGNPRFYPDLLQIEGLEPHSPQRILYAGSDSPNLHVDITPHIDIKLEAIGCHASQLGDRLSTLERIRQRSKSQNGRYLERYRKVELK